VCLTAKLLKPDTRSGLVYPACTELSLTSPPVTGRILDYSVDSRDNLGNYLGSRRSRQRQADDACVAARIRLNSKEIREIRIVPKQIANELGLAGAQRRVNRGPTSQIQPNSRVEPSQEDMQTGFGLFRNEAFTSGPARGIRSLFTDLRAVQRGQIFAEDPQRDTQGTRLMADGNLGHAFCEFYRLGRDLYIIAGDGIYDAAPRTEILQGEGLIEFHLRLAGTLVLSIPGAKETITVTGPCMLMLHQPPGMNVPERTLPRSRDTGVSLFCRPEYLAELAERNGIPTWEGLEEIKSLGNKVWSRQISLSPTLLYVANSLLRNPYQGGIRLMYAEAAALGLLCEILSGFVVHKRGVMSQPPESEARQLDCARRLLGSQLSESPRTRDIAKAVGMSESKLKRAFKAKFGVTVFNYGLECRMRYALELLRCKRKPVGQVAHAVGYRHQSSFTAAFQQFFGFLPNEARRKMH
jgi:AraC-like DNA-binding protein